MEEISKEAFDLGYTEAQMEVDRYNRKQHAIFAAKQLLRLEHEIAKISKRLAKNKNVEANLKHLNYLYNRCDKIRYTMLEAQLPPPENYPEAW